MPEIAASTHAMTRSPFEVRASLSAAERAAIAGNYEIGQVARLYAEHYRSLVAEWSLQTCAD